MSQEQHSGNYINYDSSKWADFLGVAQERMDYKQKSGLNYTEQSDKEDLGAYWEYEKVFIAKMREYEEEHSDNLNKCFDHYKTAIGQDFFNRNYCLLKEKQLRSVLSRCKVMVLTANSIERAILHFEMAKRGQKIRRIISGNNVYFVFEWGKYWGAHVHQTETGATKDLGTNAAICEALKHFTPNVIMCRTTFPADILNSVVSLNDMKFFTTNLISIVSPPFHYIICDFFTFINMKFIFFTKKHSNSPI